MNRSDLIKPTGVEGRIDIHCGKLVSIHSSRPLHAAQILIGKTPEQAMHIIPLLFSVCGTAQSLACHTALKTAQTGNTNTLPSANQRVLNLVEVAREMLLRLFRDIPALLHLPTPDNAHFTYLGKLMNRFSQALSTPPTTDKTDNTNINEAIEELEYFLHEQVFGMYSSRFTAIADIDTLQTWASSSNQLAAQVTAMLQTKNWCAQGHSEDACSLLPDINLDAVAELLKADDAQQFIAKPQWLGNCHETGSLARQSKHPLLYELKNAFGYGLLARWTARLLELASIPAHIRQTLNGEPGFAIHASAPSQDCGIASIEAARGRLIHLVKLQQGCIADYKILAPTEWNFHPQGALAKSLAAINAPTSTQRLQLAHLLVHSVDPCVAYTLEVA